MPVDKKRSIRQYGGGRKLFAQGQWPELSLDLDGGREGDGGLDGRGNVKVEEVQQHGLAELALLPDDVALPDADVCGDEGRPRGRREEVQRCGLAKLALLPVVTKPDPGGHRGGAPRYVRGHDAPRGRGGGR